MTVTLSSKDFSDQSIWTSLVESAREKGMINQASFDEGETAINPDELMITVAIVSVN